MKDYFKLFIGVSLAFLLQPSLAETSSPTSSSSSSSSEVQSTSGSMKCDWEAGESCADKLDDSFLDHCDTASCYCGQYQVYWDNYLTCFYDVGCHSNDEEYGEQITEWKDAADAVKEEYCVFVMSSSSSSDEDNIDTGTALHPSVVIISVLVFALTMRLTRWVPCHPM